MTCRLGSAGLWLALAVALLFSKCFLSLVIFNDQSSEQLRSHDTAAMYLVPPRYLLRGESDKPVRFNVAVVNPNHSRRRLLGVGEVCTPLVCTSVEHATGAIGPCERINVEVTCELKSHADSGQVVLPFYVDDPTRTRLDLSLTIVGERQPSFSNCNELSASYISR